MQSRGFTLLELMIAMAILGIISSVAFFTYDSQSRKGRRVDAVVALEKIIQAEQRYFTQNNGVFTTDINDLLTYGIDSGSSTAYYALSLAAGPDGLGAEVIAIATPINGQLSDTCTELRLRSNGIHEGNPDRLTCWGK